MKWLPLIATRWTTKRYEDLLHRDIDADRPRTVELAGEAFLHRRLQL
jgi:hypothetical protein